METLKPSATFPTPYGVSVPVVDHPTVEGEYLFGMEATAICCGIHDPEQRARFVADATAMGRFDAGTIHEYGGSRFIHLPLPRPNNPATPQIATSIDVTMPLEEWVTAISDVSRWCDRAAVLLTILDINMQNAKSFGEKARPLAAVAFPIIMTSALEHIAEREIDCLEAAAFYALSAHPEWSEPAINWLRPMRHTWFKDWVADRPIYRRFASLCQQDTDLPAWIAGGAV